MGIRHDLASIRVPQENGKVERSHGCLRTEASIPDSGTVQEYQLHMEQYRAFFNEVRPHCSLGYETPEKVFNKTLYCEEAMRAKDELIGYI